MGFSFKYPLGKNSDASKIVSGVVKRATNPVGTINKALGTKLPTKLKIGGVSIGTDPLSQARASVAEAQKLVKQAGVDWKNAGKGDIGKVVAATGQQTYNLMTFVPRTIKGATTGTLDKEMQKTGGALLSSYSGGGGVTGNVITNTVATSSSAQSFLRSKDANKWTLGAAKNYAGTTRGSVGLSNAQLSNADRNDIFQGFVKQAVVVGTGYTAQSLFGGTTAAAPATTTASSSPLYPGGATLSTDVAGVGLSNATVAEVTAASSSGGFWTTAAGFVPSTETALLGYSLFSGRPPPTSIGDIFTGGGINPGDGGGSTLPSLTDLFPAPSSSPSYIVDENPLSGAVASLLPTTPEGRVIFWSSIAAVTGWYLWRRFG